MQHFYGIWKEVWDLEATLTGARWFLTVDSAPKFPSPLPSPSKNVHNADVKVRRDVRVSGLTAHMQRKSRVWAKIFGSIGNPIEGQNS